VSCPKILRSILIQTCTCVIYKIIHRMLEVKVLRTAGFIKASKYQNEGLRQTKIYMTTPIYC